MRPLRLWRKPSASKGLYGVPRRRQEQLRQDAYVLASLCRHKRARTPYDLPEFVSLVAGWRTNKSVDGFRASNEYACFASAFFHAVDAYWSAQDQGLLP